jgi:hypothetical protein
MIVSTSEFGFVSASTPLLVAREYIAYLCRFMDAVFLLSICVIICVLSGMFVVSLVASVRMMCLSRLREVLFFFCYACS